MNARNNPTWLLTATIATLLAATGTGADRAMAAGPVVNTGFGPTGQSSLQVVENPASGTARYFIQFEEAPLALYSGGDPQIASIPHTNGSSGRRKLNVHSAQATQYVSYLSSQQNAHLAAVSSALGRTLKPLRTLRNAVNAIVVEMTPAEAKRAARAAGVLSVQAVRTIVPATDIGPQFIGATNLWQIPFGVSDDIFANNFDGNTPKAQYSKALGDGIVIGDIDTGYNSLSPSFAQTDDTGYTITNPLGAGHYLGQCTWTDISLAGCNNKVIGVYAMVADAAGTASVEDTQGHGSHTASTAAGDSRSATLNGYTAHISGVAPHANLVIYHVCAPAPTYCQEDAIVNAIDQSVADGVVDALNFSISGGFDPWNDITSKAFLSAEAAGIFVAAAAGNTESAAPPAAGSTNHYEPWVLAVAAGSHTGGAIAPFLSLTGPGMPPANTQNIGLAEAQGDTPLTAPLAASTAIVLSPQFDIANAAGTDGCASYPANTFQNAVALISRGNCNISTKIANAVSAGAIAAIVADNVNEAVPTFGVSTANGNQPVPVFSISNTDGLNVQGFLAANSNAGTMLTTLPTRQHAQPDQLASFSLLGPAAIDIIKPEVQAPGVDIIAAVNNDGSANGPNRVALMDGTSMATPHTTGAGALLAGMHPDWTPMEIKSALMLTAKEAGLTKPDGVTPSGYFDRGSGRIQVDIANKAGLVLDETAQNMQNANPNGGTVAIQALNLASMQNSGCSTGTSKACSFTRTFRSTVAHAVTWTASFSGDSSMSAFIVPASFSITGTTGMQSVAFNVDASSVASDGTFHFGEITLTPSDTSLPALHLPIAIAIQPPQISVSPASLAFSIPNTTTTQDQTLTIANVGGPTLNVTNTDYTDAAQHAYVLLDQSNLSSYGAYSTYFADLHGGSYASDDFVASDPSTNLGRISMQGFVTSGMLLSQLPSTTPLHVRIYKDAGGMPNGQPESTVVAPAWAYDTTLGAAGVDTTNNVITLDLVAAGAPATNLPPGTYWLVVYPDMSYGVNGGWAAIMTATGNGNTGMSISPTGAPSGTVTSAWTAFGAQYGVGLAMHIEQQVTCGAAWLSTVPPSLSLGQNQSAPVTVTVDSSNFDGGVASEVGYLCLQSNDPLHPMTTIRVTATQNF